MMRFVIRTAASAAMLLLAVSTADAALFKVNDTADAVDAVPGDGVCATAGGSCTLRAAIQEANALPGPDRVRIPAGEFSLTRAGASENDTATGDLDVTGRLRVIGKGVAATVVDGAGIDRVFDVQPNARVTLAKLAVRGGDAGGSGVGGGVNAGTGARLVLKRVLVEQNEAFGGGGVAASGVLRMVMSTVRENTASFGGGIALRGGSTIRASTLNDNAATGVGPVIGHDVVAQGPGTVTVLSSTITGQIQIVALCQGGAVRTCTDGADVVLANVTVNNLSRVAQALDQDDLYEGSFTLRNTIVLECESELVSQGYNFIAPEGCTILGSLNGVIVGDDPLLGSLKDNGGPTFTRLPVAVSEAVDNGSPLVPGSGGSACEPFDQRGVERNPGEGCDIGAVEVQ